MGHEPNFGDFNNEDYLNEEDTEGRQLCASVLPVVCEFHRTLDDCGSEGCSKYGITWNSWNGEDGCEEMGDLGHSPYDEVKQE